MKIQDSSVQLSASREATQSRSFEVKTEQGFRRIFDGLATPSEEDVKAARQRVQKLLQSLIDAILAAIDGKKCEADFAAPEVMPAETASAPATREISWRREITEKVSESESTTVCGKGCVKTADGRQIDFDFALDLKRDYSSEKHLEESGTVALRDPLILSFDGKSCELSAERIDFDLNADGTPEQVPGAGAGSAFLVFDRNGNGKADNGSELFGVASGNGFADLALLDTDRNGWIDEGDSAFSQLALWSGDSFASLGQSGIGALCTAAVDAKFSLKTETNELLGEIRAAGVYLSEAGQVGHLQQVDLAVSVPSSGDHQPAQRQQLSA